MADRRLPAVVRLHYNNLAHAHASLFARCIPDCYALLTTAHASILASLYTVPDPRSRSAFRAKWASFTPVVPHVESITLVIDDTKGVAYTIGVGEAGADKEIHLSLDYLGHCSTLADPAHELRGVITHELVHCYQHTRPPSSQCPSEPSPPGGLIEGVADFVRLRAGLAPPHWQRPTSSSSMPDQWDAGYQYTAYFLDWLDDYRLGNGVVAALNHLLYTTGYTSEREFWLALCGLEVGELWAEYKIWLDMHDQSADVN